MTVVAIVVEVVVAGGGVFVDTGVFSVTDDFLSPDDDGLSEKFAFWFLVGKHIHKEVSVKPTGFIYVSNSPQTTVGVVINKRT